MASINGPEAEFHDTHRKELLQALKDALPAKSIRPTAWACLWLGDLDKLEDFLALAQRKPVDATMAAYSLESVEVTARIVPTCGLLAFVLFNC